MLQRSAALYIVKVVSEWLHEAFRRGTGRSKFNTSSGEYAETRAKDVVRAADAVARDSSNDSYTHVQRERAVLRCYYSLGRRRLWQPPG